MVMSENSESFTKIYKPSEVATLFSVNPKTIGRWMDSGKLGYIKSLKGTRNITEHHINAVSSGVCRGCSSLRNTSGGCNCG
jgi:hypothetical protein